MARVTKAVQLSRGTVSTGETNLGVPHKDAPLDVAFAEKLARKRGRLATCTRTTNSLRRRGT